MHSVEFHDVFAVFRQLARSVIIQQDEIADLVRELGDLDHRIIRQLSVLITELQTLPGMGAGEHEGWTSRVARTRSGKTQIHYWLHRDAIIKRVKKQARLTVDVNDEVELCVQSRFAFAVLSGGSQSLVRDGCQSGTILPGGNRVTDSSPDTEADDER